MERYFDAAILDLDGVVTQTARLHAKAWSQLFNEYLAQSVKNGTTFKPFDVEQEYGSLLDGKSREDGIRSFLSSRNIGETLDLVQRLSLRKDEVFHQLLTQEPPRVFEDAVQMIWRWRRRGIKTAVVSSSKNSFEILRSAHLDNLFDVRIDGLYLERHKLRGKPSPDLFLRAASVLHVQPERVVVIEDSVAGIQAARQGRFGRVIGIARGKNGEDLRQAGADQVVQSLKDISLSKVAQERLETWKLRYHFYEPSQQQLREALCTLGNGYIASRGSAEEEEAGGCHYPGTYFVGGYNRARIEMAEFVFESDELVNWPNWLWLRFKIEGSDWIGIDGIELLDFYQELDLESGVLARHYKAKDASGRVFLLSSKRIVSMASPHLTAIQWHLEPVNWSGKVIIQSGLMGAIRNSGVARYKLLKGVHLEIVDRGLLQVRDKEHGIYLEAQTNESHVRMLQASCLRFYRESQQGWLPARITKTNDSIFQEVAIGVTQGVPIQLEKTCAIFTSRDHAIGSPREAARSILERAGGFSEILAKHSRAWRHLWRRCDIELSRNPYEQLILRLYIFHLLQSASPNTLDWDTGIPARGLHGEAYRGHVFWDELFIFPFYNFRIPELSRNLLMYRYRRLNEARYLARQAGFRGAMYPWQSASTGSEETPSVHINPLTGRWLKEESQLQRHVNSAIAYNIWQYYQVTKDREFISFYGAEMMFEIARFWVSCAHYDESRNRYVIRGVVGPDEFHTRYPDREQAGIDNNAYTNIMASWVTSKALDLMTAMDHERKQHLKELLDIRDEELALWENVSRKLYVPLQENGIINQFDGYDLLRELDLEAYRKKHGDVQRLDRILELEGASTNEYKAVKQADVLMLFYLFSTEELVQVFKRLDYPFTPSMIPRNIRYYMQYTTHGSTLSRAIHAWVLARSNRRKSWALFQEALESDFSDIQHGTTEEGIHLGAMAETVDLVQRCYSGMESRDEVLWFNPLLPDELPAVSFRMRYRGHWLSVLITHDLLRVSVERSWHEAAQIGFRSQIYSLKEGDVKEFILRENPKDRSRREAA